MHKSIISQRNYRNMIDSGLILVRQKHHNNNEKIEKQNNGR